MDNVKDSQKSKGTKVKQSTLFSMTRPKEQQSKPVVSSTPAFGSQQDDDDDDDDHDTPSSLQLTLQAAARKDEASLRMEETQQDQGESQFDSLPFDVVV
jgi:hypothetical protein